MIKQTITFTFLALTLLCAGLQAVNELWEAVRQDDPQKVLALLQAGANPDGDNKGKTPLVSAAAWNRMEIAKILLDNPYKKANINITDITIGTPLEIAASRGNVDMVQFLLKQGADPNIEGNLTPLQIIALPGDEGPTRVFQITKLLLDYGADLTVKDSYGNTVIDYAKFSMFKEKPNTAFLEAVKEWQDKEKKEKLFKKQIFSKATEKEFEDIEFRFGGEKL